MSSGDPKEAYRIFKDTFFEPCQAFLAELKRTRLPRALESDAFWDSRAALTALASTIIDRAQSAPRVQDVGVLQLWALEARSNPRYR